VAEAGEATGEAQGGARLKCKEFRCDHSRLIHASQMSQRRREDAPGGRISWHVSNSAPTRVLSVLEAARKQVRLS
jgi:hypothetical protein